MSEYFTIADIDKVTSFVRTRIEMQPRVGIILGSGLGSMADSIGQAVIIDTAEIPLWPVSTVPGHKGRLVSGKIENIPVLIMQGRAHYYEGYSMAQIGLPVRVISRLGVEVLIVTNAAGAVNPDYEPGDLMLITDHLNLIGMAGLSPLRGPNLDEFGPRFPDMGRAYDRSLITVAVHVASGSGLNLRQGVYICLAGPSFETPADLRFLRLAGADAVGMSTVPEVTTARHCGMRVLGISGISNKANLDGNTLTTHEEVLTAGQIIVPKLITLIRGVLGKL